MKTDRIFVLLLVVLLPMTGCFDDAVGDAEGTDDAADDGSVTDGDGTSTGTATPTQARTWYSSGGVMPVYWNDNGAISGSNQNCNDWGPVYNSSTGEYIGEECRDTGFRTSASQWNVSKCTSIGGTVNWNEAYGSTQQYRYAPTCTDIVLATINTSSGEALLMYEFAGAYVAMQSTCNGVTSSFLSNHLGYAYGNEYIIAEGSAMNCSHVITASMSYHSTYDVDYLDIWSIVYAIQDVTVV